MKRLILPITLIFCLAGCASLGIYVRKDSLTAAQHNDLGISYEDQNKLNLAEKEYKRAIHKDQSWHIPYFNLGNVCYKLSKKDEAIKYYRLGLELDSKNPDIMNNLAFVLMEDGRYEDAKEWIQKAIAIEAKPAYMDTQQQIETKLADNP